LGRFGPFRYCTNFGAKRAELMSLMHKFVQRCRVRIFRNKRTQFTPLDPKLMFCELWDRFITARTLVQNGPNWCVRIFRNERIRSTPLDPKLMLGHFELFRYFTNIIAKWPEPVPLMHKFVQRGRVEFFCNDLTRYTLFDPRLIFWGVSDHSVTARTLVQNGPNRCH
jgi:hypothetical protein